MRITAIHRPGPQSPVSRLRNSETPAPVTPLRPAGLPVATIGDSLTIRVGQLNFDLANRSDTSFEPTSALAKH
ncbi:protein of unknown function [Micropruina glycogenica]|uniref:Uncharacterized protein n=1 Tax=Micropruina glycogenica TaxID=75385 RepID=A0A2N9JDU9_9ACTN|nr:protein of unknown function [Micropruina glycogenica]